MRVKGLMIVVIEKLRSSMYCFAVVEVLVKVCTMSAKLTPKRELPNITCLRVFELPCIRMNSFRSCCFERRRRG